MEDGKLLLCHSISEESVDKKIPTEEYNNRTVYDCFNNLFTEIFVSTALKLPDINIYDRPHLHRISLYTLYITPSAIYVASENYVSNLITPSDYPRIILLPSDDHNPHNVMNKYKLYHGRAKIGYYCRKHEDRRCYKNTSLY